MQMRSSRIVKIYSLILTLVLLLPAVVSCKARPLSQTKLAKTEVGTVGNYSVLYEEFYFLAYNYYVAVKDDYTDTEALRSAVWDYVEENITTNYAILTLCEKEGLTYNEKELKDDVKSQIELVIDSDFDGSRSDYLKSQSAAGLTDHYVRFVTGVDILYGRLEAKYIENGTVPNTDYALKDYIMENFAHTWHIAILVDGDDDRETEIIKAKNALAKLDEGATMYDLIKAGYSEDLSPDPSSAYYGYYFPKGVMDEEYEKAAFSLQPGEHSEIVVGKAKNNNGQYVECFYVIERLPNDTEEIAGNFEALCDDVGASIVAEKMEKVKATLTFEKNEFVTSLDITELDKAESGVDYQLILLISAIVLCFAAVVATIIIIKKARTKHFHLLIKKNG